MTDKMGIITCDMVFSRNSFIISSKWLHTILFHCFIKSKDKYMIYVVERNPLSRYCEKHRKILLSVIDLISDNVIQLQSQSDWQYFFLTNKPFLDKYIGLYLWYIYKFCYTISFINLSIYNFIIQNEKIL